MLGATLTFKLGQEISLLLQVTNGGTTVLRLPSCPAQSLAPPEQVASELKRDWAPLGS